MENNTQNKRKFFAQYYDQEIAVLNGEITDVDNFYLALTGSTNTFLSLKPLLLITDEDALKIAEMNKYHAMEGDKYLVITTIEAVRKALIEVVDNKYFNMPTNCIDYLRSKGYALPFMGLSVEELERFGWIKLKSE